jgi:hypothetical protein
MAAAAPDGSELRQQPADLTAIHPPPALRDETGMTHIFSPPDALISVYTFDTFVPMLE